MSIEGFNNKFKAFYKSEVVGSNSSLNNFANWSLWYIQYFTGRETIGQQNGKYILVEKSSNDNDNSWMPSAVKTATYICFAVIFFIPGTIARALSLDSKTVREAVFAERITPPVAPPKVIPTPQPIRPSSGIGNPQPTPKSRDITSSDPHESSSPSSGTSSSNPLAEHSPTEQAKHVIDSNPTPIEIKSNPLAASRMFSSPETKKIEEPSEIAVDSQYRNKVEILFEIEEVIVFFKDLKSQENNREKVKKWLDEEMKKGNVQMPFTFSFHLSLCLNPDPQKILTVIPEATLEEWQNLYQKCCEKLNQLKLTSYLEIAEVDSPKVLNQELNQHVQNIINFYIRFLTQKTTELEWLAKEANQKAYFFPFFNTLRCFAWEEIKKSFNPEKVELLEKVYTKVKDRLYELGGEKYLQEIPRNLSSGYYALVQYYTQDLIKPSPGCVRGRAPVKASSVLSTTARKIPNRDQLLKEILLKTGTFEILVVNPRLFETHKESLHNFLKYQWTDHVALFENFIREKSSRAEVERWINGLKAQNLYTAPFSQEHLKRLALTEPLLDKKIVEKWRELHPQCCRKLTSLRLSHCFKQKIPNIRQGMQSQLEDNITPFVVQFTEFFEKIVNEPNEIRVGVLLRHRAAHLDYDYPFYLSQDLKYRLSINEISLSPQLASRWKNNYEKACQRLEKLQLTEYLEEVPLNIYTLLQLGSITADTIPGKTE